MYLLYIQYCKKKTKEKEDQIFMQIKIILILKKKIDIFLAYAAVT